MLPISAVQWIASSTDNYVKCRVRGIMVVTKDGNLIPKKNLDNFSSPQLQLVGMRMILSKVFLDQFAYWAPVINAIYLFS